MFAQILKYLKIDSCFPLPIFGLLVFQKISL